MRAITKVMPATAILLSAILVTVQAVAADCIFDGRYEQPSLSGEKSVAVVQGDVVIISRHDAEGRLMGTVRPHRIRGRNLAQCTFSASTLSLDDDSAWTSPALGHISATQVYRMEGRVLNAGALGLFFPSTI